MSYTQILVATNDGDLNVAAEIHNSWRGAMAIWATLEKRYLPPFMPEWAKGMNLPYEPSRTMGDGIKEIWELANDKRVSEVDSICLRSTFDNVIVHKENFGRIIEAFNAFEGETSLKEQAQFIGSLLNDPNITAIAWRQTSVTGDMWTVWTGDETIPYNILTGTKHWELFEFDKES